MLLLLLLLVSGFLAGCSPSLGKPLDIIREDYDEQPLSCLNELQWGQLIVYRHHDEEILGKLVNLSLDDRLLINPEGKVELSTARLWIYDGKNIISRIVSENDLDCLRFLVKRTD